MNALRRGIVLAVGAAFLVFASVAAAASTNPDFPHGDTDGDHWTWVDVTAVGGCEDAPGDWTNGQPCVFTAHSNVSRLSGPGLVMDCDVGLDIAIYSHGETLVDNVAVQPQIGGLNSFLCAFVTINNLPWVNQICEYTNTGFNPHEYWDRLEVDFNLGVNRISGEIFAQLFDGLGNPSPLNAQYANVASAIDNTGFRIDASTAVNPTSPYTFDQVVDVESIEEPCPTDDDDEGRPFWPELD